MWCRFLVQFYWFQELFFTVIKVNTALETDSFGKLPNSWNWIGNKTIFSTCNIPLKTQKTRKIVNSKILILKSKLWRLKGPGGGISRASSWIVPFQIVSFLNELISFFSIHWYRDPKVANYYAKIDKNKFNYLLNLKLKLKQVL